LPPGGHIDENELPCKAVVREVYEETGIPVRVITAAHNIGEPVDSHCYELPLPLEILLEDIESDGLHNHIDMIYLCKTDDTILKLQDTEIDDIGWFTVEEIMSLNTFNNVRMTVQKAIKYFI
jgi:8-oxo-dGTP pyrophosphatase MutT (NUDIX family)